MNIIKIIRFVLQKGNQWNEKSKLGKNIFVVLRKNFSGATARRCNNFTKYPAFYFSGLTIRFQRVEKQSNFMAMKRRFICLLFV
jgi:hypothetical protein